MPESSLNLKKHPHFPRVFSLFGHIFHNCDIPNPQPKEVFKRLVKVLSRQKRRHPTMTECDPPCQLFTGIDRLNRFGILSLPFREGIGSLDQSILG
jgi:hypothetical protein